MSSPFRLVLEDDRQAAWMAINDTFKKAMGRDNPYQAEHGFLVQLGTAQAWAGPKKMVEVGGLAVMDEKGGELYRVSGEDLADAAQIWWVNVWRGPNPMSFGDLIKLRVVAPDLRPLHKFHTPYQGGITIWPGGSLRIIMETAKKAAHVKYTFELDTPVTVEIHERGVTKFSSSGVYSVVVEAMPEGGHRPPPGETENPPQYP